MNTEITLGVIESLTQMTDEARSRADDIFYMIKDYKYLKKFEDNLIKKDKLSYEQKLKIFEAMWEEAITLGVFPLKNPLEGIEIDIQIARIVNSCSKNS